MIAMTPIDTVTSRDRRTDSEPGTATSTINAAIAGNPMSVTTTPNQNKTSCSTPLSAAVVSQVNTIHADGTISEYTAGLAQARRPSMSTATRNAAVAAAHNAKICSKKIVPYTPRVKAGHHAISEAATVVTASRRTRTFSRIWGRRNRFVSHDVHSLVGLQLATIIGTRARTAACADAIARYLCRSGRAYGGRGGRVDEFAR
jgi:hypothetical protein